VATASLLENGLTRLKANLVLFECVSTPEPKTKETQRRSLSQISPIYSSMDGPGSPRVQRGPSVPTRSAASNEAPMMAGTAGQFLSVESGSKEP